MAASSGNAVTRLFRVLGPGLISGSADDDPSGIGTYAIAGAALGYATLWTAVLTIPMMVAVQFTCANTVNAGADLGAIAAGVDLVIPVPHVIVVIVAAAMMLALQVAARTSRRSWRCLARSFRRA